MSDPKFRLDPDVDRHMRETGESETEAANSLGLNYDEIWDVVENEDE